MWLRKGIPAGAGLGGGSADAAAAFAAVRRMLEVDIGDDELLELGADGRLRRPVLPPGRRGVDAGPGRAPRAGHPRRPAPARRRPPPVPDLHPRRVPGVGRAGRPHRPAAHRRPARGRRDHHRAGERPRSRRGAGRAPPGGVPPAARGGGGGPGRSRRERLGVRRDPATSKTSPPPGSWPAGSARRCGFRPRRPRSPPTGCACRPERRTRNGRPGGRPSGYLPCWRRCQRVFFSSFLCFFLRMRLRRFLISDPMRCAAPYL